MTSLADTRVIGLDAAHAAGSAVVFVAIAQARGGAAQCQSGDVFEPTAWSADNRAVVTVLDLGDGAYRMEFRPKLPGTFRVCLHLFFTSRLADLGGWPEAARRDEPFDRREAAAATDGLLAAVKKSVPLTEWCPSPSAEYDTKCVDAVVGGSPALPERECPQDWRSSLGGSWVRAASGECSPGICRGDLRFQATDGWVFVPDECYLRLYNTQSAWDCLAGKRVLWFGDSTSKQPATDLVEMVLRVPVLKRSFRWQRDHCPTGREYVKQTATRSRKQAASSAKRRADMGCNIQFDHRQWLVVRRNPRNASQVLRMRHIWGGGPVPSAGPGSWPRGLDLLMPDSYKKGRRRATIDVFRDGLREQPDAVFLHAYVWDDHGSRQFDRYAEEVRSIVDGALRDTPPSTVVQFGGGHPQCLDDRDNPPSVCHTAVTNKLLSIHAWRSTHLLDRRVRPRYAAERRFTMSDRYAMAEPHVMGPKYCHFGIHFGAHPQYCYMWEPADPQKCFRNWLVDKFEIAAWLNAVCPAGGPLPLSAGATIEDGVNPADEAHGGLETQNAF